MKISIWVIYVNIIQVLTFLKEYLQMYSSHLLVAVKPFAKLSTKAQVLSFRSEKKE